MKGLYSFNKSEKLCHDVDIEALWKEGIRESKILAGILMPVDRFFPEVADKLKLVPNISLPEMIYKLAKEPVEMPPLHGVVFATVGHVSYNKGIDLVIGASKILKQKGLDFSWILDKGFHLEDSEGELSYYVSKINGIGLDNPTNSYYLRYIYYIDKDSEYITGDGSKNNPYEVKYDS